MRDLGDARPRGRHPPSQRHPSHGIRRAGRRRIAAQRGHRGGTVGRRLRVAPEQRDPAGDVGQVGVHRRRRRHHLPDAGRFRRHRRRRRRRPDDRAFRRVLRDRGGARVPARRSDPQVHPKHAHRAAIHHYRIDAPGYRARRADRGRSHCRRPAAPQHGTAVPGPLAAADRLCAFEGLRSAPQARAGRCRDRWRGTLPV